MAEAFPTVPTPAARQREGGERQSDGVRGQHSRTSFLFG